MTLPPSSSIRDLAPPPRKENTAGVDFKDVNNKIPALFSALNNPLFNNDNRNAAVRDLYEDIDQVVPLGWKFVAAVICPSGEILISSMQLQGNISWEVSHKLPG